MSKIFACGLPLQINVNMTSIMQNLSYLLGDDISADQKEDLETRLDIIRHKLKYSTDKPILAIINHLEPLTLADVNADLIDFVGAKLIEKHLTIIVEWFVLELQSQQFQDP